MKKILILTLTLVLLSLVVFAQGNYENKGQQNLQKRNEQVVRRLQNLEHQYSRADKKEIKERLSKNIEMEFNRWYADNMNVLFQVEKKQVVEEQKPQKAKKVNPVMPERLQNPGEEVKPLEEPVEQPAQEEPVQIKDPEQVRQEMLAEIKAGKIPELMLETVSQQFALQIKQREEAKAKKQNEKQKEKQKKQRFKII